MTDRERIEADIRALLQSEARATILSNKLFSPPDGLFCRLGATEAVRREIGRGELFRAAQDRINELEREELERLRTPRPAAGTGRRRPVGFRRELVTISPYSVAEFRTRP